jgi:pyruvate dehydrogenase E2 component (dihydrolipoamide acetyltransferase)
MKLLGDFLAKNPDANGILLRRRLYVRNSVSVSCIVALDKGQDLTAAKIEGVHSKTVVDVARDLRSEVSRIRALGTGDLQRTRKVLSRLSGSNVGRLMRALDWLIYILGVPPQWLGVPHDPFGGAIVTSVSSYDVDVAFAPLIWFTRAPLLVLVNGVRTRPAVVEGEIVARPTVIMTCTFDHRFLDGAQIARLANSTRKAFADPWLYLMRTITDEGAEHG